nr:MAG TPA: hypothetical protein [Caudoviricetes sp.]DAP46028.1 MAG TPA: hypothetical protein [Caudoviricetes sp.]
MTSLTGCLDKYIIWHSKIFVNFKYTRVGGFYNEHL